MVGEDGVVDVSRRSGPTERTSRVEFLRRSLSKGTRDSVLEATEEGVRVVGQLKNVVNSVRRYQKI